MSKPSSQVVTTITGVAIGTILAVSATIIYIKNADFDVELGKIFDPTPVQAVMDKLPQVAIIGQKQGPAETTEVFIQVPGILNMQSVYVLSDNETVISGFIIPETLSGSGVPGGQIELPTGQPTVDPRAPRAHRQQIMSMAGRTSTPNAQQAPATPQQPPAPKIAPEPIPSGADTSGAAPVPVPMPAPKVPQKQSDQTHEQDSHIDLPGDSTAPESVDSTDQHRQTNTDYLKISDLFGRTKFRNALSSALSTRDELVSVKQVESDQGQQKAYLNLVRSLPSITQGSGPKQLYVLFDPNCPVCHAYYKDVAMAANAGRVTVNWIPTTIFPEQAGSITAGARLLDVLGSDGLKAASQTLNRMMTQPGYVAKMDQAFSDSPTTAKHLRQIVTNTGALVMARAETPLIVFESVDGELVVDSGIPQGGYLNTVKSE